MAHPVATKCTVISSNFIIPTTLPCKKKMRFDIADNVIPCHVILEISYPVDSFRFNLRDNATIMEERATIGR